MLQRAIQILFGFLLLQSLGRISAAETGRGAVVVLPVNQEISSSLALFVRRGVKSAESEGASALVLDMDTYGGRLDSAEKITDILNHTTIPTYTYVNSNAGSAGSLIALATKHIYMAPVSAIGAAAPVLSTGEDLPPTEKEKTISYWSAFVRGIALRNGHNPDIAEAFMNKDQEVKVADKIVHSKGTLLTLNAQEATQKVAGRTIFADGIADSIDDLVRQAKLDGNIVRFEPSGFEHLAFWLTELAPLLLLGGILSAYIEMKVPGFGIAGIISVVCFALFFLGHYFAGLAGWEVAALFVLGAFFVVIEVVFFGHSTVVFGVVGVLLMLISLVWAMIDRYPGERFLPTGTMLKTPVLNLFLTFLAAAVFILVLARFLPRTSIYRRFILSTTNPPGPSLAGVPRAFATSRKLAPGMQGRALTILRPSGKAEFQNQVVDVVTEGDFIAPETKVAVVSTDGMRVVVRGISA